METQSDQGALFRILNPIFSGFVFNLWVNGRKSNAGEWWAVLDNNKRLFSGIDVVDEGGKCTEVMKFGTPFHIRASFCNDGMNGICEFRGPEELLGFEF
jgi:hypothetical protein